MSSIWNRITTIWLKVNFENLYWELAKLFLGSLLFSKWQFWLYSQILRGLFSQKKFLKIWPPIPPLIFFEVENWKPAQTDKIHRANRTSDSKTVCSIVKNNPKYYPPMKIGVGWRHLDRLWRHRNFRNTEKFKIVISSICTPLWKPILVSKCAQKNFPQPTRKKWSLMSHPPTQNWKNP